MTLDPHETEPRAALTPAAFQILVSLADADRHGYAMMQEIQDRTSGAVNLSPGTLYGTLKKLLAQGLVTETAERPDPALDDERRRYYRLTEHGRRAAAGEARRLATIVDDAWAKRLLPGTN